MSMFSPLADENAYEIAREKLIEGDIVAARAALARVFAADTNRSADVWYLAGQLAEEPDKRLAHLQRALELDPSHEPAQQLLDELMVAAATPADDNDSLELPVAVRPAAVSDDLADLNQPALYYNIELGWLDFNWRVLYQALDDRTPLLERVRFIAITASNLDEFTQKRVGGLKRQDAAGVRKLTPDGRGPREQINLVREAARVMHRCMSDLWVDTLRPELDRIGQKKMVTFDELSVNQQAQMSAYFTSHIYPILTPLADDTARPFPFISSLSLSLAVVLQDPDRHSRHYARVKVPANLPRFLVIDGNDEDSHGQDLLLPVESLIANRIQALFPGMELECAYPFRVTRNADVRRDEEEAEDLLEMISEELRERRFASVVRLEVDHQMPEHVREWLRVRLNIEAADVYESRSLLDLTALFIVADQDIPDASYYPWSPRVPFRLRQYDPADGAPDIFTLIRQEDIMVHHPYDSFDASVLRLVQEAARDPNVLAIKQTLYRTSSGSPIVQALIQAAQAGKQVAALVELRARFDEENNINWARVLERAGVHVTYGLMGLKTHTKVTLVVREEGDLLRTYCHVGTGNYNSKTARLYTDLGVLSCRPEYGRDVVKLFHFLTGYAPEQNYDQMLVAPTYMRPRFVEMIRREIAHQEAHGNGRIVAKMNGLDHVGIIKELYKASQAGVQIDLIIRGHSRLRPGIPGVSDNIRLISILGRFLEHDRIFSFDNNGEREIYIGSADWRGRNLNSRVELIAPVLDPKLRQQLWDMMQLALNDNRLAWDLQLDGRYIQRRPQPGEGVRNFHEILMRQALDRAEGLRD